MGATLDNPRSSFLSRVLDVVAGFWGEQPRVDSRVEVNEENGFWPRVVGVVAGNWATSRQSDAYHSRDTAPVNLELGGHSARDVREEVNLFRPGQVTVTLRPESYSDARTIGEYFREGVRITLDLSAMSFADSTRIIDFAAGLVFGRRGLFERTGDRVFVLMPAQAEVPAGRTSGAANLARLTGSERKVAQLVAAGLTANEIANQLSISRRSAKALVRRVLSKVDVHSPAELAIVMSAAARVREYGKGTVLERRVRGQESGPDNPDT